MTGKQSDRMQRFATTGLRGLVKCLGAAALAALFAGLAPAAWAQSPDPKDEIPDGFGHSGVGDLPNKRFETTGAGMPSIRGPFPDTANMTYLGQITNAELRLQKIAEFNAPYLSDIWGWTSPAGQEYALVGTSSGVVFVRITDPENPEFLGLVPTTNLRTIRNFWWDLKTFGNYLYWTTEVDDAGVGIFDLSQLDAMSAVEPATEAAVLEATGRWGQGQGDEFIIGRAHNIVINPAKAIAYVIGVPVTSSAADDIVVVDLSDPLNPVAKAVIDSNSGGGPVDAHDAQVVTYAGPDGDHTGREILFNYNGNERNVQIWDVTNPEAPFFVSETTYPGAIFTHQGWLTEDQAFALVGDEADEEVGLQNPNDPDLPDTARTYILDVRNLDQPVFLDSFDSPAETIDHNLFVKGDKVYQANYIAGVRVLQIADQPDGTIALSEIAHMDTEPRIPNRITWNVNRFIGPWGVFPFFESGTIAASDGLNGLVLMKLSQ